MGNVGVLGNDGEGMVGKGMVGNGINGIDGIIWVGTGGMG